MSKGVNVNKNVDYFRFQNSGSRITLKTTSCKRKLNHRPVTSPTFYCTMNLSIHMGETHLKSCLIFSLSIRIKNFMYVFKKTFPNFFDNGSFHAILGSIYIIQGSYFDLDTIIDKNWSNQIKTVNTIIFHFNLNC